MVTASADMQGEIEMWKSCYRGRPLKFRGVSIDTGKIVYAELGEISAVRDDPDLLLFLTENPCLVETESVRQLVGYSKFGTEVYEGDVLVDKKGSCKPPQNEFTIELKPHGRKHDACVTFEVKTKEYSAKRLKEV